MFLEHVFLGPPLFFHFSGIWGSKTCAPDKHRASDSPISPITMACFDAIKATSPNNDDPEHASRPFDNDRDGFVMGEGGALNQAAWAGSTCACRQGHR